MTSLNLFALTSDRILRFSLSADVQQELTDHFVAQEKEFYALAQDEFEFDGKYKPDEGECLVIKNYDDIDDLHGAIANPLSIPEISPDTATFASIKALFAGYSKPDGSKVVLLQSFDKRKVISTRGLSIFHASNVYKKVEGVGLTIDTKLSALLSDGTLKFFSFHVVRQMFDLTQYYTEATDNDIIAFANSDMLHVDDVQKLISIADTWVRRKVSLVKQSGILDAVPIHVIVTAAVEFAISLDVRQVNGKDVIALPEDKAELKKILRFLDEDYYKSPLSLTNFLSNSKRKVPA